LSQICEWLHERIRVLPLFSYPFDLTQLPKNGIYFFYEKGEHRGHAGQHQRIVRIGTHKDGNFRSRIAEHFLLNEKRMNFGSNQAAPHERSIFRKNIGRALLNRDADDYLKVWELDFTSHSVRQTLSCQRDIDKEKQVEAEVTRILRENFSFRYIQIESQEQRMGRGGLESKLIGTVAGCKVCQASESWLGYYSPIAKIRNSGLWLVQHLAAPSITDSDTIVIDSAIAKQTR